MQLSIQVKKPFLKVCLGGTFDHLHEGHKHLLRTASKLGQKILIGLTTEELLKSKKHREQMQSYKERERGLIQFLERTLKLSRAEYQIVPLEDPFGPAISESTLDSMICSSETYRGCLRINQLRARKGLRPLVITLIPLTLNKAGTKLSSTDIRGFIKKKGGDNA